MIPTTSQAQNQLVKLEKTLKNVVFRIKYDIFFPFYCSLLLKIPACQQIFTLFSGSARLDQARLVSHAPEHR